MKSHSLSSRSRCGAYSHHSSQRPLRQGCTRVSSQTLLVLWQKILLPTNKEAKSENLAATRMQTQNFPGGAADGWGSPCMPVRPMDLCVFHACEGTEHHHTPHTSSIPFTHTPRTHWDLSHTRIKKNHNNYAYVPPPLPSPFAPQTNQFSLAQTYWNKKATWCL